MAGSVGLASSGVKALFGTTIYEITGPGGQPLSLGSFEAAIYDMDRLSLERPRTGKNPFTGEVITMGHHFALYSKDRRRRHVFKFKDGQVRSLEGHGIEPDVMARLATEMTEKIGGQLDQRIVAGCIDGTFFEAFFLAARLYSKDGMILGGYVYLVDPPKHEQEYQTPVNSLTFSDMGVDGVRYALIKLDGRVTNDSPVVQVDPMSSEPITVVGATFLDYLADGCNVSRDDMESLFETTRKDRRQLIEYLDSSFDFRGLLHEDRTRPLNEQYLHLVEPMRE